MALQEAGGTLASKEKIPFFVKEAVKWVDITDFILLRFGLSNLPETEKDQIKEVASVIRTEQMEAPGEGEIFNLSDKIEPSGDFRIGISRKILKNISLPVYLTVLHKMLKGVSEWNNRVLHEAESTVDYREKDVEQLAGRKDGLEGYIALTEKVADAAGISLT